MGWLLIGFLSISPSVQAQQITPGSYVDELVAAQDTLYVEFVTYWAQHERRTLRMVKGDHRMKDGVVVNDDSSLTHYEIRVMEETPETYQMRWKPLQHKETRENPLAGIAFDESMLWDLNEAGVTYQIDTWGTYEKLTNSTEVLESLRTLVDTMVVQLGNDLDDSTRVKFKSFMGAMLSPEIIESTLSAPMQLYHELLGYQFPIGFWWDFDYGFPNFFGGDPFPATGKAIVHHVDTLREEAHVYVEIEAEAEAMKNNIVEVLVSLGSDTRADIEAELAGIPFTMTQEQRFVINYNTGWVESLTYDRRIQAPENERHIFYRMELDPPPPPVFRYADLSLDERIELDTFFSLRQIYGNPDDYDDTTPVSIPMAYPGMEAIIVHTNGKNYITELHFSYSAESEPDEMVAEYTSLLGEPNVEQPDEQTRVYTWDDPVTIFELVLMSDDEQPAYGILRNQR